MMAEKKNDHQRKIVWLLLEQNYIGVNKQCITLAEHLNLDYECKMLSFNKEIILSESDFLAGSLKQLNRGQSTSLSEPWPDLLLVPTKSCEQIALWIKKASQKKTKIVRLGKIRTPTNLWDLIISPRQYVLPRRTNILRTNLPICDINNELIQQESLQWKPQVSHLPEPYIALFLGGPVKSFPYTEEKAKQLAGLLNRKFHGKGSLLISTSRRTPAFFYECLINHLQLPYYSYSWSSNNPENPYFAFLGMATEAIIAGDSISMLAEATIAGKFIHIYYHRRSWFYSLRKQVKKLNVLLRGIFSSKVIVFRDDRRIHRYLISKKKATMLQEGKTKKIVVKTTYNDDLECSVRRVRQLLESDSL